MVIIRLAISIKQWLVTDRQTHGHSIYYGSMASCSKTVYSVTYKILVPTLGSAYLKISEQKSNTAWCWWFGAFNASLWRCWQQHMLPHFSCLKLQLHLNSTQKPKHCRAAAILAVCLYPHCWRKRKEREGKGKGGDGKKKWWRCSCGVKGVNWPPTLEGGGQGYISDPQ